MLTLKIDGVATVNFIETSGPQQLVEQIAQQLFREGRLMLTNLYYYQSLQG